MARTELRVYSPRLTKSWSRGIGQRPNRSSSACRASRCCGVERVYVHRDVFDDVVHRLVDAARAYRLGNPLDRDTTLGPMVRTAAADFVRGQVAEAVAKGARALVDPDPFPADREGTPYLAPQVLVDVDHGMRVMSEESFGPVIGIQRVSGDDEALSLMNDTRYGLTAGVYSKDRERASRILSAVRSGSVYWNCCDRVSPRLPWSGRGHSGIGATLGRDGIRAFLQPKAWHLRAPRA